MGHQYMPEELINPKSTLTGDTPEMRDVANWYIDLTKFKELLEDFVDDISNREDVRPLVSNTIKEFMTKPLVYIKNEFADAYEEIKDKMPPHRLDSAANKTSFSLEFDDLDARDKARDLLNENSIRFRAGKTLVPFRLTGNIEWGVPAPVLDGEEGLTIWVWPESLWAPISFTKAYLEQCGKPDDEWKKYWCSDDSGIYQFIGQDNIYFYGIAEPALFIATQGKENLTAHPEDGQLKMPTLVANNHILFLNKKASSSGAVKPPMADGAFGVLLARTPARALPRTWVGVEKRKLSAETVQHPAAAENEADPVMKEGKLLSNVFNRVARSCFYTAQKYFDAKMPARRG